MCLVIKYRHVLQDFWLVRIGASVIWLLQLSCEEIKCRHLVNVSRRRYKPYAPVASEMRSEHGGKAAAVEGRWTPLSSTLGPTPRVLPPILVCTHMHTICLALAASQTTDTCSFHCYQRLKLPELRGPRSVAPATLRSLSPHSSDPPGVGQIGTTVTQTGTGACLSWY